MTRAGCAVAILLLAGAGCDDPSYAVRVDFDPAELADGAYVVELAVVESCEGQDDRGGDPRGPVLRQLAVRRGETPRPLGSLVPGRYGLHARARGLGCVVVAAGCRDVIVEGDGKGELAVTLTPVDGPGCAPNATCATGQCLHPGDGGLDAGRRDAGHDGGRDSGQPVTAACTGEGEACSVESTAGICHGGECCTGCWNGTACQVGDASDACGAGGAACTSCECPTGACSAGACVVPVPVESIASGYSHTCAVAAEGTLWCWGNNSMGQLGLGDAGDGTQRDRPGRVGTDTDWVYIAAGDDTTCGMRADGVAWCWGENSDGQLGLGDMISRAVPQAIPEHTWTVFSGGNNDHNCGLDADGSLWCWGENVFGQLGLGDTSSRGTPTQVGAATWAEAAPAGDHTCGIRSDGTLWCWGKNESSELGLGDVMQRTSPAQVGTATWDLLWPGFHHQCARRSDGEVLCWGDNDSGQLGVGDNVDHGTPTALVPSTGWLRIASGVGHSCGIRDDGTLWCWGRNDYGQLGLGAAAIGNDENTPVQVGSDADWSAAAAGQHHTCAVRGDGTVWCTGRNHNGQLGQGHRDSRDVLRPVCF